MQLQYYVIDIPSNCFHIFPPYFSDPNNLKSPNEEDCDQQCIGGCHRGKDKLQCFACKNVMYEFSKNNNNHTKNCIDKCPEAFLLVSNFFQIFKKYV